jgi:hypothetical protein
MVNLSNHHKISRSGKLHSVIDNGLKSCIFIKVDDLLTSGRYTALRYNTYEAVSFDQSDNEFQEQMNKSTG